MDICQMFLLSFHQKQNLTRVETLTRYDGDRSTDVSQFLPGEVLDQASYHGCLPHLGRPDHHHHDGRGVQRAAVHVRDMVLLSLQVLGSAQRKGVVPR